MQIWAAQLRDDHGLRTRDSRCWPQRYFFSILVGTGSKHLLEETLRKYQNRAIETGQVIEELESCPENPQIL